MSATPLLAGVSVLDTTRARPGAVCARILRALGAAVVPLGARPDIAIVDRPPAEAGLRSADPAGPLSGVPAVISVTAFGLDGPYADRPDAEVHGLKLDSPAAAALAGAHAAVAGLAALRWTRLHGRPVLVEISTFEVLAGCLGDLLPRGACPWALARSDSAGATGSAIAVLPCADGYVGVSAPTPEHRARLAARIGDAEAARDQPDLDAVAAWLSSRTRMEAFHEAQLWRLPCVPVLGAEEVTGDDHNPAPGSRVAAADGKFVPRSPFQVLRPDTPRIMSFENAGEVAFGEKPSPQPSPRGRGSTRSFLARGGGASLPLSDVRVLDLGMMWAGPHCGRLLAALGAEVIKVEGPRRWDGTRPADESQCWGAFADLNAGKSSLVLDLSAPSGRSAFLRVAEAADVVLENFSPRVMPNFGLAPRTLLAANPALLVLSMPAFGSDGPWADYLAYGSGLELATGLWSQDSSGCPTVAPVPYLDYLAGAYGAVGILAGLIAREADGRGSHLEVAQREVACQVLHLARTTDRTLPGSPDSAAQPLPGRGKGRTSVLSPASREGSGSIPGPFGPDLDPAAIAADPHLATRGLFAHGELPAPPPCQHYARLPWRLHGVPSPPLRPAPSFGSDTRRILRAAGFDQAFIRRLIQQEVIVAAKETH